MKSNDLLSFSRNRYYKGKMLTSADFEAEQLYMNNKRRFVNRTMMGAGIACGLNVISLDDLSLMVESGAALDDMGREIVVNSSVVKKLSAIAGFESLTTNVASLCVRYKEKEEQPVYSINRQDSDKEFEYNRIEDDYELVLMDSESFEEDFEMETEFYTGGVLMESQDYQVRLRMPANVCAGHYVKLEVTAEKLSAQDGTLFYEGILQTPVMTTTSGSQELSIRLEGVKLEKGETLTKEYWMLAQTEAYEDTGIMIKAGSASASVNQVDCPVALGTTYKINVVDMKPELLAARESSRVSLELRTLGAGSGLIRLADISLVRTDSAYLIEKVDDTVREYIETPSDDFRRKEYTDCFFANYPFLTHTGESVGAAPQVSDVKQDLVEAPKIATGIVEIPVGDHAKRGDICYSGEVMHGLGSGNVYVEVGYEYLEENVMLGTNTKTTIYGDLSLFDEGNLNVAAKTAVKVFNDKGSFQVALQLEEDVSMLVLTYRWVAIRYDSDQPSEDLDVNNVQSISLVTPTVVMGTRESYCFQVKFNNMKDCSISYELTEPGSGDISADGIYTAPGKEGVYEIRIYCTDKPLICTYAYAIVKKKASSDSSNEMKAETQAELPEETKEATDALPNIGLNGLKKGLL